MVESRTCRAVAVMGEVVRPGRIEWSDEMDLIDLLAHVGGSTRRADTSKIEVANNGQMTNFDLDQYILDGSPASNLPRVSAGTVVRVHALPDDPSDNKSQWVSLKPQTRPFTCLVKSTHLVAIASRTKCTFSIFFRPPTARRWMPISTIFA